MKCLGRRMWLKLWIWKWNRKKLIVLTVVLLMSTCTYMEHWKSGWKTYQDFAVVVWGDYLQQLLVQKLWLLLVMQFFSGKEYLSLLTKPDVVNCRLSYTFGPVDSYTTTAKRWLLPSITVPVHRYSLLSFNCHAAFMLAYYSWLGFLPQKCWFYHRC